MTTATDLEDYCERVDESNRAIYVADISVLDGRISDALPLLTAIIAVDPNAIIADGGDHYDCHYWQITWHRMLRPEEIAKRERDQNESRAKRNREQYEAGRREYERLKAIYEPPLPQEQDADGATAPERSE